MIDEGPVGRDDAAGDPGAAVGPGEEHPIGAAARLARVLRQRISLERSFGRDVPLGWPIIPQTLRPEVAVARGAPAAPPARPALQAPAAPADPAAPDAPELPEPQGERALRRSLLEPLREEVAACRACVLCERRTRTVFGTGDPCAQLLFVGEGPGEEEDRRGEPFVGPAGQLLTRMIGAMGLRREDVYIANIVKCRPPGNRNPEPREILSCLPYLHRQIGILRPRVICTLGNVATRSLLETQESISHLRGGFHDLGGIPVLPTFHPSYLLRNPEDKRLAWADLRKLMELLGLPDPRADGGGGGDTR